MMIRCRSVFSLCLFYFFFKRTMRVVVYLSLAFMKEEDETGDRQISFFFLLLSFVLYKCKQVFTKKKEQKIACYTCLSISFSFYYLSKNCTIRSILGQSLAKTNREFFFFSLSFSRKIQAFFRLLLLTEHKSRTRKGKEEKKKKGREDD